MQPTSLSSAIQGFTLELRALRRSPFTIKDYSNTLKKLTVFIGADTLIDQITHRDILVFLEAQKHVSNKTLLNYHIGLSSLWTWAVKDDVVENHIMRKVPRPKPEKRRIDPYSPNEVNRMLSAVRRSRSYKRPGQVECNHTLPNAARNYAILLLLLDTGIRADELCQAKMKDIDLDRRRLKIIGKGDKERTVPFSQKTAKEIKRYLSKDECKNDPIFLADGNPMNRGSLYQMIHRTGERAGVSMPISTHRFRHTFAIEFLRGKGRPLHLQQILGHATMEMVNRYVLLAQVDLDQEHEMASPVKRIVEV